MKTDHSLAFLSHPYVCFKTPVLWVLSLNPNLSSPNVTLALVGSISYLVPSQNPFWGCSGTYCGTSFEGAETEVQILQFKAILQKKKKIHL